MKEKDIRPPEIFKQYLELCEKDIETFFSSEPAAETDCPACKQKGEYSFTKQGFSYEVCPDCHTLFVNPRPSEKAFSKYYTESESVEFWATTFYRETETSRREKIWKPKARLIHEKMERFDALHHVVIDIGGGYGVFAQEMEKLTQSPVIVIEPGPQLAVECRSRGLQVIEKFFGEVETEELPAGPRLFVSFELFEHLHDPEAFLATVHEKMSSSDLFIFTTLSGTGIDILTLWEDSQSVSPPHHLNFFNPESIGLVLNRTGFGPLEISTPGKLDIDLLCQHASYNNRFWKRFNQFADSRIKSKWQNIIAETGWSSHMMVICKKGKG